MVVSGLAHKARVGLTKMAAASGGRIALCAAACATGMGTGPGHSDSNSDRNRIAFATATATTLDGRQHFYKLGNMDEKTAVVALAALAQEARLRVFRTLVGAGPQGLTPGALSALLDIPNSTLSFHLKELVNAGLVSAERDGRNLHYSPAFPHMNQLLAYLTDHCCQGQPCAQTKPKRRAACC